MSTMVAQSVDPRAGTLQPLPEGLEYRAAVPLWGPYYQMSPWAWSDLPQESFYNPRTYPFPAVNPFIPQRSGAFIQPGQADVLGYKLLTEGEPMADFDSEKSRGRMIGLILAGVSWFLFFQRKIALSLGISAVALYFLVRGKSGLGQWFPEDPTGGAYGGGGDPIYGDVLGPGENIAVASQWAGTLKPRGFVATTVP